MHAALMLATSLLWTPPPPRSIERVGSAPAAMRQEARRLRAWSGLTAGLAVGGFATTVTMQRLSLRGRIGCLNGGELPGACVYLYGPDAGLARFGGHALAVTGLFGTMHLLGQARAWHDAAAGRRTRTNPRQLPTVIAAAALVAGIKVAWIAPLAGRSEERACKTVTCAMDHRRRRFAITNGAVVAAAAGAGYIGYVIGRRWVAHGLSMSVTGDRSGGQLVLSGRF